MIPAPGLHRTVVHCYQGGELLPATRGVPVRGVWQRDELRGAGGARPEQLHQRAADGADHVRLLLPRLHVYQVRHVTQHLCSLDLCTSLNISVL